MMDIFDKNLPSPLQQLKVSNQQGIKVWIKRDDLIHDQVSGNKWRKLKYNIHEAQKGAYEGIITYGGAFSNHIVATASACQVLGFNSIGIIRGERDNDNPTIQMVESLGMDLHFVSRQAYRLKDNSDEIMKIIASNPNYFTIPEGGANVLAVKGTEEIVNELRDQLPTATHIVTAVGTGTTLAGLVSSSYQVIGIPVLKHDKLSSEIEEKFSVLLRDYNLISKYHFGGYGKWDGELISFIHEFYNEYGIALDVVYTAKAMYGLMDMLQMKNFPPGSEIVFLHTGGLQGNDGFKYRFPDILHT